MINKNRFGVANDKKLLRKIGKQWVTVSALTLVLLGGGAVASSIVTHADTTTLAVEAQDTNNIKEKINNNLDKAYQATQSASGSRVALSNDDTNSSSASSASANSVNMPSNIESKATNMYRGLMLNAAAKSSSNSNSSSANAKSSVAPSNSVSASAKPSFNSAYQSYMAKMSGTDSEVASVNNSHVKDSNNNNQNKPVIKHNLGDTNYFTGTTHAGTDDGLNYIAYANGGVEFTGGTAQSDLSFFGVYSDIENAKSIKFDNAIDTSKVTNMGSMFHNDESLRSLKLSNSFDTSKVTDMSNMFDEDESLQSLTLPSSFDTSKVTDMDDMFRDDSSLQSLTLPSSFDTSKVTNMSDMFQEDSNLQSLTLPNSFNTSNVTDMDNMFNIDGNLQSLTLPSSFDTSNVTDMSDMFDGDSNLQSLTLSSSFDTSNVTDMSDMFHHDTSLQSLTIQSPDTKINSSSALLPMYKTNGVKDFTGRPYTASKPNDFSDGNMGTFLSPAHIPTDTINYQYNGATKGSQQFKASPSDYVAGKYIISDSYKDLDVTSTNAKLPNGYHLVNNDNNVKFDNGTYDIAIMPNAMATTVDYQYNGATKGSQTFTANLSDYNVNVNRYNDMDITSSDDIPKGYRLVNTNNKVPFDNGTHNVAIVPNTVNVQYHDIYGDSDGLTPPANTAQQVSSDGTYTVNTPQGWALVSPDGFTRAPSASGYVSKNVTVDVAPYTNGLTFDYDKNDNTLEFVHRVPSKDDSPYYTSDIKSVKSITFGSDAYMNNNNVIHMGSTFANDDNLRKVTIKSNKTKVSAAGPFYDSVFANDSLFPLRPIQQTLSISEATINRADNPQGYLNRNNMYDKKYKVKNGAEIYATTPSETINPLQKINGADNVSVYKYLRYIGILQGRPSSGPFLPIQRTPISQRLIPKQVPDKAKLIGEAFIRYPSQDVRVCYVIESNYGQFLCVQHDLDVQSPSLFSAGLPFPSLYKEMANGGTAPEPNKFSQGNVGTFVRHASTTINYQYNGKTMATQDFTGAAGTSFNVNNLNDESIPSGYQLVNKDNDFDYDGSTHNVAIEPAPNMVVGTAFLTLLYKKGNRTDGQVLRLHINGNIGDSDIIINPQDYDKPGYQVSTTKDWHIPFDYSDVKKATHDFSRYNAENTFIYNAQPISINIDYVDTQTGNPIPNTSTQKLSDVAYDGDTIDLQDANSSNGVISIDGNNYRLNLPQGYHLAHANNYIRVAANGAYTKQVANVSGGFRSVRMPLMKLTLGITPRFHKHDIKPANPSSVTPVKPSSASSVAPQSASSANGTPNSTPNVAPSSASQSIAPDSTAPVTPAVPATVPSFSTPVQPSYATYQPSSADNALVSVSANTSTPDGVATSMQQMNTAQHQLSYLHQNRHHVAHALRQMTRAKVTLKQAKEHLASARAGYRFYALFKRYTLVHTKPSAVGHFYDRLGIIKPRQRKVYLVLGMKHGRYFIMYHGHKGYVTANHLYIHNAYYQNYDMKQAHRAYHHIQVLRDCYEYKQHSFKPQDRVRTLHRHMTLEVRRVVTIAKYHMTRFQLANGHWVTANKDFVRLIK